MWVVCVWKVWFHKWAYVYKRKENKSWATRRNNIPFLTSESVVQKRCCAFYHQRLNLSCKKFYQPKANLSCCKWRKSRVWHDSRFILSNQKSVFKQLAAPFIAKQIWTWVVKLATYHRFSTRSAAMLQSRLHVFVAPFAAALLVVSDLLPAPSICFFCALMGSRTKKLICFVYYHERQMFRSCKQHLIQTGSLFCKLQKKMKTLLVGTWR